MGYWNECLAAACEEAGVNATSDQIAVIAGSVEVANERLKRELREERSKMPCSSCGGSGRIITQGPSHSAESECSKCRGEGRSLYA